MNEKFGKILKIGLSLIGASFVIYKLVKAYNKGMEEIEEQEFRETEDLENAGVNTSKLREEIDPEETDFTKMLFTACYFNADFDVDLFDPDEAREVLNDGKTIHILQKTIDTKNGPRRYLDFLIEIPDYTDRSYRGPKIGNFLTEFKKTAEYMRDNLVKFSDKPKHTLFGFVVITREINGEFVREYRQVKDTVYSQYRKEESKHDGLTDFYITEKPKLSTTGPSDYLEGAAWLFENCPDLDPNDETLCIEDIVLMYWISFPVRSNRQGELFGIETKTAIACIKYLTDELCIQREGSKEEHRYDHLLFNAHDYNDEPNLAWFYTVDEEDRVVVETWDE